ncbi:septum formation family protein [Solwaraspora sp. WMMD406]|uniref:septum formation family protein n=1 Tax=Solwaraspora sp. WMMD406 TaxID=3016095 RepID=UPI002415A2B0|nr:septum formation family protein [Solwaraspora sp. WMMD406]MDG4766443.1 septum formation family protein [Solwaraspora sp. WMMD406]
MMAPGWRGTRRRERSSSPLTRMVAVLAAASLAVIAGCVPPPQGLDGDLTDGWAAFDAPSTFVPKAGVCHREEAVSGSAKYYLPVDCARLHRVETVHVGTFTGADARRPTAPVGFDPTREAARTECETHATRFLGDLWQHGALRLTVVMPPQVAWEAGARWFRCDLAEVTSVLPDKVVPRTGSLRGALAGDAPLLLRCYEPLWDDRGFVGAMEPVDCGQPHRSEFVGTFDQSTLPPVDLDNPELEEERFRQRCLRLVADYVGLPVDDDLPDRVDAHWYRIDDRFRYQGDPRILCFLYLWTDFPPLTRSAKDGGPALLPVR